MSTPSESKRPEVAVRQIREQDLPEVRRIFRVAFGTFVGAPDPERFAEDREFVFTRWRVDPGATLVAEVEGRIAGSNFATNWGSFGFFGPLTVAPEFWNGGVAQALLGPTIDLFSRWGCRETGLYTFANSPKHLALYQRFGFWPRFLTAILTRDAGPRPESGVSFSSLNESARTDALRACRELTGSIYDGLDVTTEVTSVFDQGLGDTVLLWGGDRLEGFGVCHCGEVSEAGRDNCYVKFAAVGPGPHARGHFGSLLNACEALAAARGLTRVLAGVSVGRRDAYREMLSRGFRISSIGVAMHRPDSPAYNRPDAFVLDDWR